MCAVEEIRSLIWDMLIVAYFLKHPSEMLKKPKVKWLGAEVSTFFCKGPGSEYFQLGKRCVVPVTVNLALPRNVSIASATVSVNKCHRVAL